MTAKDILALVNAGFTKEEIAKMAKADSTDPEPKKTEEQKPDPKPEEKPEQKAQETSLEQKFNMLMEKLNSAPFLGATQPEEETVDDIIASIINPPDENPFTKGGNE